MRPLALLLCIVLVLDPLRRETFFKIPPMRLGLLQDGDLVFRRTEGGPGRAIQQFDPDAEFTHVGILIWLDGSPWVVHAQPSSPHLPEGRTLSEPLESYLTVASISGAGFARVETATEQIRAAAAQTAWRYNIRRIPFDDALDLDTADRLYCTEMVWKAYLEQGVDLTQGTYDQVSIPFARDSYIFPSRLLRATRRLAIFAPHESPDTARPGCSGLKCRHDPQLRLDALGPSVLGNP